MIAPKANVSKIITGSQAGDLMNKPESQPRYLPKLHYFDPKPGICFRTQNPRTR